MSSITWTDTTGTATLENDRPVPADRLANWTPRDDSIGLVSIALDSGRIEGAKSRRDGLVSFEMPNIPGTSIALALRLKLHLMKGGLIALTADSALAERWAFATLAPETVPSIALSDITRKTYTFAAIVREAEAPSETSTTVIDPTDMTPHPDAYFVETYGKDYADDTTAWKASFDSRYDSHTGGSAVTLDPDRLFDGHASGKATDFAALNLYKDIAPGTDAIWVRSWIWLDDTATNDTFIGATVYDNGSGDFPSDGIYANDTFHGGAPCWTLENYTRYTPDALAAATFTSVKGRWVPIIAFYQIAGASSRTRWWVDAVPAFGGIWDTDLTGALFETLHVELGTDDTGKIAWYGQAEFILASDNADPYGLL